MVNEHKLQVFPSASTTGAVETGKVFLNRQRERERERERERGREREREREKEKEKEGEREREGEVLNDDKLTLVDAPRERNGLGRRKVTCTTWTIILLEAEIQAGLGI